MQNGDSKPTIYRVDLRRIGVHQLPWFPGFWKSGNQQKPVEWKPRKGLVVKSDCKCNPSGLSARPQQPALKLEAALSDRRSDRGRPLTCALPLSHRSLVLVARCTLSNLTV